MSVVAYIVSAAKSKNFLLCEKIFFIENFWIYGKFVFHLKLSVAHFLLYSPSTHPHMHTHTHTHNYRYTTSGVCLYAAAQLVLYIYMVQCYMLSRPYCVYKCFCVLELVANVTTVSSCRIYTVMMVEQSLHVTQQKSTK